MKTTDQKEILAAIKVLQISNGEIKSDLSNVKSDLSTLIETVKDFAQYVHDRFLSIDDRFDRVETRLSRTEAVMVTKEYLDDKLADLRSDLGLTDRNTNIKIHSLTDELVEEKSLKPVTGKTIKSLPPFASAK